MFSYEDRLRAVPLYIKLGKRTGLTIRQLGYPTKNALMSWYREFEGNHDLRAGYARRPRYPEADKRRAVDHYLDHGRCIAVTIKALGYSSRALLSAWLQELHPQDCVRVVSRSQELATEAKRSAV
jgi:putative transposase